MNIFEYMLLLAAVAVGGAGVITLLQAHQLLRSEIHTPAKRNNT
jgi:hypothetical protein